MTDVEIPVARGCPFAVPAEYERLRESGPISRVELVGGGGPAWWVSGWEEARVVLSDPRFSADRRSEHFPVPNPDPRVRARYLEVPPDMLSLDGAAHAAARRAVIGEFTLARLNAMRPRVQEIVDGFVDAMLAAEERPVDLVRALSLPVPSLVICELLGVPYDDHDFFQAHSSALLRDSASPEEKGRSLAALRGYLDELITRKEKAPGDDLFGRQIRKQRAAGGVVDRADLAGTAFLLLIAGHETTANMISLGVVGLLERPEQLAAIKADPSKTLMAVEEMLRYFSIVSMITSRVATEDVELGGVTIKADDGVVISGLSANWDPTVFDHPADLDVGRGARHHVAFGFGPHQCLGQNLARLELRVVFDMLFRRIPDLRLAVPLDEVAFRTDANVYGVLELPVTW